MSEQGDATKNAAPDEDDDKKTAAKKAAPKSKSDGDKAMRSTGLHR